jgi:hypothetical protein
VPEIFFKEKAGEIDIGQGWGYGLSHLCRHRKLATNILLTRRIPQDLGMDNTELPRMLVPNGLQTVGESYLSGVFTMSSSR